MSEVTRPEIITDWLHPDSRAIQAQLGAMAAGVILFATHAGVQEEKLPGPKASNDEYLFAIDNLLAGNIKLAAHYHRWRAAIHHDGFNRLFRKQPQPALQKDSYLQPALGLFYNGLLPEVLQTEDIVQSLSLIARYRYNGQFSAWVTANDGDYVQHTDDYLQSRNLEVLSRPTPEVVLLYPDLGVRIGPFGQNLNRSEPDKWSLNIKAFPRRSYEGPPNLVSPRDRAKLFIMLGKTTIVPDGTRSASISR